MQLVKLKISVTGTKTPESNFCISKCTVIEKMKLITQIILLFKRFIYRMYLVLSKKVSQSGVRGIISSQEDVNIRGMDGDRVLMQVDGINLPKGIPMEVIILLAEVEYVDFNTFKSVEVLKGPASTLYGSDALGGVNYIIDQLSPSDLLKEENICC